MYERDFAAAWEDFDYPAHFHNVRLGDLILMYANRKGIIAIGLAKGKCEVLQVNEIRRIKDWDTPEWRVPVKWVRWVREAEACSWTPHTDKTFIEVSSDRYAQRREKVLKHFGVTLSASG